MIIKNFIFHFEIKVFYEPEAVHILNHNQELTDAFIHKMTALKTKYQQNIYYT